MVSLTVALSPKLSVTVKVSGKLPAVVGVPLTTPVDPLRVKPPGSVPEVTVTVLVPTPDAGLVVLE